MPSAQEGPRLPYVCRCGQLSGDVKVCDACRAQEREPQGETVRLFEPAPTQLAGQLSISERALRQAEDMSGELLRSDAFGL